jgi:hypothetical protein
MGWFTRKSTAYAQHLHSLAARCHGLELRIKELEDLILQLRKSHEALRGRFYASGAHKEPAPPQPTETKASVLREFFTPGKPARHT